jgi:tetratricopeptide (TPR) repeat protein
MSGLKRILAFYPSRGIRSMQRLARLVPFMCVLLACPAFCHSQGEGTGDDVGQIANALRSRDFARALTLSQSGLSKRPGDFRIWTLRGMASAGMGSQMEALSAYESALKLAPNYLPALEGAAQTEFQMGHAAARPLLERVLVQRPDDATSHAMLGVLDYRKKNCAGAVEHFQKAATAIGSQPGALSEYGACLGFLNRDEDAVTVFAQALALDPARREARYNLALAQSDAHHADDALATLQPLMDAVPADEDALNLGAEILEAKGDTPRATEVLRNAIVADPKHLDAYLQFAMLSFDHASSRVGIDMLNAGLAQLPNEPRLYLVRGILLTQLGEFTQAAEDFEAASRIDPRLSFLGVAEGLVKSQQHEPAEALKQFRADVEAHPNEAYAHYLLAEELQERGEPEGSPEYKEEIAAAERAVKLDPRLVAARDLLSAVYLENGHTDLAIEQARAALALDPNDQQAVYHLIVAMRKSDQRDELPALLKRLVDLRANAETHQATGKHYRLSDDRNSTDPKAP